MEKSLNESSTKLLLETLKRKIKNLESLILYFKQIKDDYKIVCKLEREKRAYECIFEMIKCLLIEQELRNKDNEKYDTK